MQALLAAHKRLTLQSSGLAVVGLKNPGRDLSSVAEKASTPALGTPSLSVDANLSLGASSNVFKGGKIFLWADTVGNLALGDSALASVSSNATYNTAVGQGALKYTTGSTSYSFYGSYNTASGAGALFSNTTGFHNTASGSKALHNNTTGGANTASGSQALYHNTTGGGNTASGVDALFNDTIAGDNTASGADALYYNTTGAGNTANGKAALSSNASGDENTASGDLALFHNTTGSDNTASGASALRANTTGSGNVAIGFYAGCYPTAPNDSIFIDNRGASRDTDVIEIGTEGTQTKTFIAGVYNVTTDSSTTSSVVVSDGGQLGTVASSRRFKQDIEDMGDVTDKLYELRPVTFRYKKHVKEAIAKGRDPQTIPRSYGLIAEDVAKVFPDLVIYDKNGRPQTVLYRFLAPMLLNELQKEHWKVIEETTELKREKAKNDAQETELRSEHKEIAALRREDSTQQRALEAKMEALASELSRFDTRVAKTCLQEEKGAARRAQGAVAGKLQR